MAPTTASGACSSLVALALLAGCTPAAGPSFAGVGFGLPVFTQATPSPVPGVVTTPAPGASSGTIRDTVPPFAVEGRAMIAFPSRDTAAPRMKSICPPMPL